MEIPNFDYQIRRRSKKSVLCSNPFTLFRHSKKSILCNYQTLGMNSNGVCSPTVRIIAFQAIDPGSTPGKRRHFSCLSVMLCDILGKNQN
nr:hypothetical protein MARPO_0199s0011 [Ipomoea batatas]GMC51293.1 hypothetical protein MARPO_0199s0011 [Ipomoea batatas]